MSTKRIKAVVFCFSNEKRICRFKAARATTRDKQKTLHRNRHFSFVSFPQSGKPKGLQQLSLATDKNTSNISRFLFSFSLSYFDRMAECSNETRPNRLTDRQTHQKARLTIAELFEHGQHHARCSNTVGGTSSLDDAAFLLAIKLFSFNLLAFRLDLQLELGLVATATATIISRCRHCHRYHARAPARRQQHDSFPNNVVAKSSLNSLLFRSLIISHQHQHTRAHKHTHTHTHPTRFAFPFDQHTWLRYVTTGQ